MHATHQSSRRRPRRCERAAAEGREAGAADGPETGGTGDDSLARGAGEDSATSPGAGSPGVEAGRQGCLSPYCGCGEGPLLEGSELSGDMPASSPSPRGGGAAALPLPLSRAETRRGAVSKRRRSATAAR